MDSLRISIAKRKTYKLRQLHKYWNSVLASNQNKTLLSFFSLCFGEPKVFLHMRLVFYMYTVYIFYIRSKLYHYTTEAIHICIYNKCIYNTRLTQALLRSKHHAGGFIWIAAFLLSRFAYNKFFSLVFLSILQLIVVFQGDSCWFLPFWCSHRNNKSRKNEFWIFVGWIFLLFFGEFSFVSKNVFQRCAKKFRFWILFAVCCCFLCVCCCLQVFENVFEWFLLFF